MPYIQSSLREDTVPGPPGLTGQKLQQQGHNICLRQICACLRQALFRLRRNCSAEGRTVARRATAAYRPKKCAHAVLPCRLRLHWAFGPNQARPPAFWPGGKQKGRILPPSEEGWAKRPRRGLGPDFLRKEVPSEGRERILPPKGEGSSHVIEDTPEGRIQINRKS